MPIGRLLDYVNGSVFCELNHFGSRHSRLHNLGRTIWQSCTLFAVLHLPGWNNCVLSLEIYVSEYICMYVYACPFHCREREKKAIRIVGGSYLRNYQRYCFSVPSKARISSRGTLIIHRTNTPQLNRKILPTTATAVRNAIPRSAVTFWKPSSPW